MSEWIDKCIEDMINPEKYNLSDICKHYNPTKDIPLLKSEDHEVRNRFWNKCSLATEKELDQILNLLKKAVKTEDSDIIFLCSEPLKRTSVEIPRLLDTITGFLEEDKITNESSRSVLHEVLVAHASIGKATIAKRWMMICKKRIKEKGLEAFFDDEGKLLWALSKVSKPGVIVLRFFKEMVGHVNEASPEVGRDIENYIYYKKK